MSIVQQRSRSGEGKAAIPSIDKAVNALRDELASLNYNLEYRRQITEHVYRERSLVGLVEAGLIDVDDLDRLTEAFVGGFDEVPINSKLWDRIPGRWITAEDILPAQMTPTGVKPRTSTMVDAAELTRPVPPSESRAFARQDGRFDVRHRPTLEDWKEYQRYCEWRDSSFVHPDVLECEASEIGRPFNRI